MAICLSHWRAAWLLVWLGWAAAAVGALLVGLLIYMMRLPRLAYDNGELLVYLRSIEPVRVPIDAVECFFSGQAPSMVGRRFGEQPDAAAVVARLSESAVEWREIDVKPALGRWSDGYIVIRGTWTEPINAALVERLNARLVKAHRQCRSKAEAEVT